MNSRGTILLGLIVAILALGGITIIAYSLNNKKQDITPLTELQTSIMKLATTEETVEVLQPATDLANKEVLNILLLGIDRRSKQEAGYRTDIMILATLDKTANRVVLTSVPRDLWVRGGRINALYINEGFEGMQEAFVQITGLKPDRFVLTDFEDFSWLVDLLGGVPVNVETTFTDTQYPVDATKEYQTISFTQGPEVLSGERALIFARSRKGDNDNGDWGRMKRQHLILKGMVEALTQPNSFICKDTAIKSSAFSKQTSCEAGVNSEVLANALRMITTGHMDTNLKLEDLAYLWDFYKERANYKVESIFMDYNFVYSPPMEEYGGAWVLAPIGDSYVDFQKHVNNVIKGIPEAPVATQVTVPSN